MEANSIGFYKLPTFYNNNNDPVALKVDLGNASGFTAFKINTFTFKPQINDIGTYKITLTLTDKIIPILMS